MKGRNAYISKHAVYQIFLWACLPEKPEFFNIKATTDEKSPILYLDILMSQAMKSVGCFMVIEVVAPLRKQRNGNKKDCAKNRLQDTSYKNIFGVWMRSKDCLAQFYRGIVFLKIVIKPYWKMGH